jgi:hypothetical protein
MSWCPEDQLDDYGRMPGQGSACQCHGEMPGRCPGPANCPMCDSDEPDEEDADGDQ